MKGFNNNNDNDNIMPTSGVFMCKRCGDVEQCTACLLCGDPLCPKYHGVWDKDGDISGCPHQMMNGDVVAVEQPVAPAVVAVENKTHTGPTRLMSSWWVLRWMFGYTDCRWD